MFWNVIRLTLRNFFFPRRLSTRDTYVHGKTASNKIYHLNRKAESRMFCILNCHFLLQTSSSCSPYSYSCSSSRYVPINFNDLIKMFAIRARYKSIKKGHMPFFIVRHNWIFYDINSSGIIQRSTNLKFIASNI